MWLGKGLLFKGELALLGGGATTSPLGYLDFLFRISLLHTDSSLVECLTPGKTLTGSVARVCVESLYRSPAVPQVLGVRRSSGGTCACGVMTSPTVVHSAACRWGEPWFTASGYEMDHLIFSILMARKLISIRQFFFSSCFIVSNIYLLSSLCASFWLNTSSILSHLILGRTERAKYSIYRKWVFPHWSSEQVRAGCNSSPQPLLLWPQPD